MTDAKSNDAMCSTKSLTPNGYDASRFNALRHGILSQFAVLPWEDPVEYETLVAALTEEHKPSGPTETHLVVELAGVLWRKRRLRQAEVAAHQRALQEATVRDRQTTQSALITEPSLEDPSVNVAAAIKGSEESTQRDLAELECDLQMTLAALEILTSGRNRAYEESLEILHESTREGWLDQLTWEPDDYEAAATQYEADPVSLMRWLETEILPWYDNRKSEIAAQPLVRTQALGESLNPDRLERLGRYEVHLDRKFERTLSTLIRLQELRRARPLQPEPGTA